MSEPQHIKRQQTRSTLTCFGLADKMLSQLEKQKFEPDRLHEKGKSLDIYAVKGIAIPQNERGVAKIHASSAIALYAINQELNKTRKHINAGFRRQGDDVHFWIEPFDIKTVDFRVARKTVEKLKTLFKEAKDPTVHYPDLPKRAEGSFWMGPYNRNDRMVDGVMGLLLDFHDKKSLISTTLDMHDGTVYIQGDKTEMTQFLQNEGLIGRGRAS